MYFLSTPSVLFSMFLPLQQERGMRDLEENAPDYNFSVVLLFNPLINPLFHITPMVLLL